MASQTPQVSLIVRSTVNQNQPVRGARRSSAKERKLLMEIKVLDCPKRLTPTNIETGCVMNKAELFTSDLRAAFVTTRAKEGLMLLLDVSVYFHFLTCIERPLKVNKSLMFSYYGQSGACDLLTSAV